MTHYSRLSRIVIDAPAEAYDAQVGFWREALGIPLATSERYPDYHGAQLSADGFGMLVQRLGDGPARVHVDIHTSDRAAEVARLERLGAVIVDDGDGWTIMRDPAGLVFCVVPDSSVNETNGCARPG